jgi:formate hydrogenlyase subunit 3/multisubunit Na+/H+ antiporter MnhD subunit
MPVAPYLIVLALPMALAAVMTAVPARNLVWRLIPFAPLPALALALLSDGPQTARADWLVMGLHFGLDEISRLFIIFTALLWAAAGASARHWMRDDRHAASFGVLFLLAQSGNLGLILAQDALGFYVFFALMSFASYGLILHGRSKKALDAARLYIAFVVVGELALFAGLALATAQTGTFLLADLRMAAPSGVAMALMLVGLGVKLGVMPLHFWLPPAHGSAPAPASAVLSGAMIKAGLFGMIVILPLGQVAYVDLGTVMLAAGMVTIFAALLLGVQQNNPKEVLGYSSVSQMGILALGLGTGLMVPAAWGAILPVLVFLAAHHALSKGALFLGTGAYAAQQGWGRIVTAALILVPALVLAGWPASSGALGKEALKSALAAGSPVWLPWLTLALTLSGVATALLMMRYLALLHLAPPSAPARTTPEALLLPFVLLAAMGLALPWVWPVLAGDLGGAISTASTGTLWPVGLGIAIAAAVAVQAYARQIGWPVFIDQLLAPGRAVDARLDAFVARQRRALRRRAFALPAQIGGRAERWRLGQTAIAGLIVIFLAIALGTGPSAEPAPTTTTPDLTIKEIE